MYPKFRTKKGIMPAGRPKIADEIKEQKGTLRKCRKQEPWVNAPHIEALPDPPEYLDEIGVKEWRDKVDVLDKMKMLKKTDLGLLGMLCREFQNYLKSELAFEAAGKNRYYTTESGRINLHPAHAEAQAHLKAYIELCNQFGFSPASRTRLPAQKEDKPQSLAEQLRKAL